MTQDLMPNAANLEARLRQRLAPTALVVVDESHLHAGHVGANESGFGTHFRVRVASHSFAGKSRVACHRLVYDSLQDFIAQGLHALAIETETPDANPRP
ncbi:MAG: BolA family transcriptional regulator [Rhodoferax sp.]|nr:BolA family transcriptional regulator [Rhodoferax sp.]